MPTLRFGDWLKAKRGMRGSPGFMSQQALADRIGIDRTYLNRIERGFIQLPEDDLRGRIHSVFGTSDDDLKSAGVLVEPGNEVRQIQEEVRFQDEFTPEEQALLDRVLLSGARNLKPEGRRLLLEHIKLLDRLYGEPPQGSGQ